MSSDIFENQDERFDNIKKSAEHLGGTVKTNNNPVMVVNKKCGLCYGKGTLKYCFPGNDGNKQNTLVYCKCVKRTSA